ncbi:MAG: thioredoxin-disulfide reductase [Candidatus Shapirobacteria bacterium]|nr:thioredoxin-disulfide reductase [Candidatus Shapirobacteria bacterium]
MIDTQVVYDTLIVGSGPAGLTAAIYNIRADLKTLIIAGNQPGGQLTLTTYVDNYPGFSTGIGGVKLMMDMQSQVKNLGGEIKQGVVKEIKKTADIFDIYLENGEIIKSKSIIIATGAQSKWLGIKGEKELIGHGVSGCATCDGIFFKDKVVAVVGGGNTACEDGSFLAKFASKIYMIHRRDKFRAVQIEQKRILGNNKIEIWWNSEVTEIIGQEKLEKIKVKNNLTGEEKLVEVDGLFVAIGREPSSIFLQNLVELEESGYVVTHKNPDFPTMTSTEGIFAAGDCADSVYRQAVAAAGDGCKAALDVQKWLENGS